MVLQYILLFLGIACLVLAVAMVLYPKFVAAIPAYAGLVLLHYSYYIAVPTKTFIEWGVMTAMVAALAYISPKGEPDGKRSSNLYVGLGAMAGALVGIVTDPRFMVLGVALGAAAGQFMYSRTPDGSWLDIKSKAYWQYFCAKCFATIVAVAIIGIAIKGLTTPDCPDIPLPNN